MLSFLARHAGQDVHPPDDPSAVWGDGLRQEAQYLHAYVHRLRQKLGDSSGGLIRTAPGSGTPGSRIRELRAPAGHAGKYDIGG